MKESKQHTFLSNIYTYLMDKKKCMNVKKLIVPILLP